MTSKERVLIGFLVTLLGGVSAVSGCRSVSLPAHLDNSTLSPEQDAYTPAEIEDITPTVIEDSNSGFSRTPPEPLAQGGQALSEVSRVKMPPVDAEALLEEDQQRGKDQPLRFAKPIKVEINPETDGTWETLDDGTLLWRLRIQSPDAVSLSLGFGTYYMPPEGRLFLYTPDHNTVIGPFTAEDNEEHGQLWTPIIKGDTIVVEVQLPADAVPNLNLELTSVNHGYKEVDP